MKRTERLVVLERQRFSDDLRDRRRRFDSLLEFLETVHASRPFIMVAMSTPVPCRLTPSLSSHPKPSGPVLPSSCEG